MKMFSHKPDLRKRDLIVLRLGMRAHPHPRARTHTNQTLLVEIGHQGPSRAIKSHQEPPRQLILSDCVSVCACAANEEDDHDRGQQISCARLPPLIDRTNLDGRRTRLTINIMADYLAGGHVITSSRPLAGWSMFVCVCAPDSIILVLD